MKHANVPVFCLLAKDRVLPHDTVGALYESEGFIKERLSGHNIK
jgi:hypothetical protein